MVTAPAVVHTALGDLVVGSKDYNVAKALGLLDPSNGFLATSSSSGVNGHTSTTTSTSGQDWFDMTSLVNVINALNSGASSGDVAASGNTQMGNAVSGAATVVANLINLLASAWSWTNGNLAFFMQNILGNQKGNIILSPTATSGGGGSAGSVGSTSGLSVNAKSSGSITNDVNLNALSGNASATGNTAAGNVGTGSATAEVNIMNLIDTLITSGQSFFGILNIFGNLNGDVLFPNGFVNGVTPSSSGSSGATTTNISTTGPGSSNAADSTNTNNAGVMNSSVDSAVNHVTTTAQSGNANVSGNSSAGSIQTGLANTTQGLFNLANSTIFGDNAVLVIVNVLGHWIGKIMTLPGGTTESALLTDNATVGRNESPALSAPGSTNGSSSSSLQSSNVSQKAIGTIDNNVSVRAQSGNADASQNTKVGDVSTGNASATSAVANIFNSVLNIKHWFGVLIINVFGSWTGSVGDAPVGASPSKSVNTGQGSPAKEAATQMPASLSSFREMSQVAAPILRASANASQDSSSATNNAAPAAQVLAASATSPTAVAADEAGSGIAGNWLLVSSLIVMGLAGLLAWAERKLRAK